jgi:hypothetical protein
MADTKVSALTANTAPLAGDYLYQVDDPTGTPAPKRMTIGDLNIANAPVQGQLINGYISRTVSSNNLVIAIKTVAGSDPSATDPVYVRIGNSVRTITAALSVTATAGTDIFGYGASLCLSDQDLFVYLGYRAAGSTVFIAASRLPYGVTYAAFSSTATAYNYLIYSGLAPASTDEVENIGRVNVTTSGSAAYNWSVPATSIVISRPIYESRWLDWTPTLTGFSANPGSASYRYKIANEICHMEVAQGSNGTSNATGFTITIPVTAKTSTNASWGGSCWAGVDNGSNLTTPPRWVILSAGTTVTLGKDTAAAAWTNANGKRAQFTGYYEI